VQTAFADTNWTAADTAAVKPKPKLTVRSTKLKLTAAARKLLSKRKLAVRLTTQPSNGTPLTQTYTLQR